MFSLPSLQLKTVGNLSFYIDSTSVNLFDISVDETHTFLEHVQRLKAVDSN